MRIPFTQVYERLNIIVIRIGTISSCGKGYFFLVGGVLVEKDISS